MRLTVHDQDDLPEARLVEAGLDATNAAVVALRNVRPLIVLAREQGETVVGGAVGRTWGACCELRQLWVESRRGASPEAVVRRSRDADSRSNVVNRRSEDRFRAVRRRERPEHFEGRRADHAALDARSSFVDLQTGHCAAKLRGLVCSDSRR